MSPTGSVLSNCVQRSPIGCVYLIVCDLGTLAMRVVLALVELLRYRTETTPTVLFAGERPVKTVTQGSVQPLLS